MEVLKEALTERGYNKLTSVQEAVIVPELEQRDLLVSAETGSGKTVGFGLAIAPTLLGKNEIFEVARNPLGNPNPTFHLLHLKQLFQFVP